jgi:hypothetical protein
VFDRFKPTRTARLPKAYLLPGAHAKVARLLVRHGVVVERLAEDWVGRAESFVVSGCEVARQPFQGHRLISLEGTWSPGEARFLRGSFRVSTAQPLGLLAFHLLEPESLDGAFAWGIFGEGFDVGQAVPLMKVL